MSKYVSRLVITTLVIKKESVRLSNIHIPTFDVCVQETEVPQISNHPLIFIYIQSLNCMYTQARYDSFFPLFYHG